MEANENHEICKADQASDPSVCLLCELIRRASVTPDDAGCQDFLTERLRKTGFSCEPMPFGNVKNLWARLGTDAPVLCFAGHSDVVPPGAFDQWDSDPFKPTVRGKKLYGRGAADMKSGLAAMTVAAERFAATHSTCDGSLALLITSDEEGPARDGTRRVVDTLESRGDHIEWCVVGEPSSERALGDMIRIGRRGSLNGQLTVNGVQGHVAYPDLVVNPIERIAPALAELHNTDWDQGNDQFPPTSFQMTQLSSGGDVTNVTPANLHAKFNFRYSTEWNDIDLRDKVANILGRHDIDFDLEWNLSGEPFLTAPGKLTSAAVDAIEEVTGLTPVFSTGGGTSDGRFISPFGTDVIELGPINESIHKVNEHVFLPDVSRLSSIYLRIMELLLT